MVSNMSSILRVLLLLAGIFTAIWILFRIHKSKVKVEDAIFWVCLAGVLLILGIFPSFSYWLSKIWGIQSPVNCVFLLIISLLIEKIFTLSIKLSQLEDKLEVISAEVALRSKDLEERIEKDNSKEKNN